MEKSNYVRNGVESLASRGLSNQFFFSDFPLTWFLLPAQVNVGGDQEPCWTASLHDWDV